MNDDDSSGWAIAAVFVVGALFVLAFIAIAASSIAKGGS